MRTTTISSAILLGLLVGAAACVAPVGGTGRPDDDDDDDDPDAATGDGGGDATCVMKPTMNLTRKADVPSGCWDAGTLTVSRSDFADLGDLGDLRTVQDLTLTDNANMTGDRAGVAIEVTGKLIITGNPRIVDLDGLYLRSLTELRVERNERLDTLELDLIDIAGPITIAENDGLTGITLDTQVEDLSISRNPQLITILGLTSRVNGDLTIDDNDALQGFELQLLRRVEGALTITNNGGLANLDPLWQATKIGTATISGNPLLAGCRVQEIDHCVPGLEFDYTPVQGCCRCGAPPHE
jgi:hypothetical protein